MSSLVTVHAISIHALREEGDVLVLWYDNGVKRFLSTPSARRATRQAGIMAQLRQISIHALREEGDLVNERHRQLRGGPPSHIPSPAGFWVIKYPPPPRGGRRELDRIWREGVLFLSTPSARRATWRTTPKSARRRNFYPRPPRGGRLAKLAGEIVDYAISIHALREEGDVSLTQLDDIRVDFYPRPPRGGRHGQDAAGVRLLQFLSTPSARRATRMMDSFPLALQFLSTPSARRATYTQ